MADQFRQGSANCWLQFQLMVFNFYKYTAYCLIESINFDKFDFHIFDFTPVEEARPQYLNDPNC